MGPELALGISSIAFGFMGLVAIARPERVTQQFGIMTLDVDGRNEVRAVYGGFGLVMAALLAFVIANPQWRAGVALAIGLALFGMAFGRLISASMDRSISRTASFYLVLELIGTATLLYAAFAG